MNFGIISTANIGRKCVIPAIQQTDPSVLAIASRDVSRAESVAEEFDIPRAYGSYEALLDDSDIDAIYNPLPNSMHAEWTKRAADAGLDVLCEKPLGVDAAEAAEMTEYCADSGVTLMEAFMYRYHPRTERAAEIARDQLGEVRRVDAQFHFPLPEGREDIRLDPDLAGGSLMDVGCYSYCRTENLERISTPVGSNIFTNFCPAVSVSASRLFLGEPDSVYATALDRRNCGVETSLTGVLEYSGGRTATISSGFGESATGYTVLGTEGRLTVDNAFVPDGETALQYTVDGRTVEERFDPVDQYQLEVEAFLEAISAGSQPRTDGSDAVKTLRIIDALSESVDRGEPVSL